MDPARRRATYEDLLQVSDLLIAEIEVAGTDRARCLCEVAFHSLRNTLPWLFPFMLRQAQHERIFYSP
jgi:hypothetical protein